MPIYKVTVTEQVTRVFEIYIEADTQDEAEEFCGEAEADEMAGHEVIKSIVEDGSVDHIEQVAAAPDKVRVLNLSELT